LATGGGAVLALEAVVLAAGAGTRFGGGKLMAPWRGERLIDASLLAAMAAPVRRVTLVTGADRALVSVAGDYPGLRVVHAADHAEGMAASLRAGIAALPPDTGGVFVFLGDMPLVPRSAPPALAAALAAGAKAAAPVFGGRRGHPVLFGRGLFTALLALSGDEGARSFLDLLGDDLALIESPDDGVLFDVDLKADLRVVRGIRPTPTP
jgi:molybdenum cofactor cytidylyltransferase